MTVFEFEMIIFVFVVGMSKEKKREMAGNKETEMDRQTDQYRNFQSLGSSNFQSVCPLVSLSIRWSLTQSLDITLTSLKHAILETLMKVPFAL